MKKLTLNEGAVILLSARQQEETSTKQLNTRRSSKAIISLMSKKAVLPHQVAKYCPAAFLYFSQAFTFFNMSAPLVRGGSVT
eukprot:3741577-Amphidinium_carterae.1